MIYNDNPLNKFSRSLLETVNNVMEKKTNKHGHDAVGEEDPDIDNDGDVDGSDKYLHNRRKAIAKSMKKEEVEGEGNELVELSVNTMRSYTKAAKDDPAFVKRKGKISADRKATMAKRTAGIATASKKIGAVQRKEYDEHKDVIAAVTDHMKTTGAHKILAKHGFKKVVDNPKRDIFSKNDNEAGIIHTVTVHKGDKPHSDDHISSYTSTTGWQSSDDRHYGNRNFPRDYHKMADLDQHKANAEQEYDTHIKNQMNYHHKKGLDEAVMNNSGEMINEALDAAGRYGQHYGAIKDLMKSITQHVDNHKSDALKHRNYKGVKGVNWSHVADVANIHTQLADIHDRLAMRGEYAKSVNEAKVDGVAAGSMDDDGHLCATKVFHKEWAEGTPIFSQHAEPDADGNIDWYDVMFEHGIEKRVMTEDLEILTTESHMRHSKRKMKEDVEAIDELSAQTKDSYVKKAVKQLPDLFDKSGKTADGARKYYNRKNTVRKIANEDLELEEARGRPRKVVAPVGTDPDEPEPRQHIMQQLARARLSMKGGSDVTFKDGSTHNVPSHHAQKIIAKYFSMQKPADKEEFQKKIGASHAAFKQEI
jgi:hypothetical protein